MADKPLQQPIQTLAMVNFLITVVISTASAAIFMLAVPADAASADWEIPTVATFER